MWHTSGVLTFSVTGVNLLDASSGPKVIKTWDDRLDESASVHSGVDDEVRRVSYTPPLASTDDLT